MSAGTSSHSYSKYGSVSSSESTIEETNNNITYTGDDTREKDEKQRLQRQASSYSSSGFNGFMRTLLIEPIVLMTAFAGGMRDTVKQALIQDKICLQKYNGSRDFCKYISTEEGALKDEVITYATLIITLKELLILLPIIVNAIYIGSWCDRYANGKRYCIIANSVSMILESLFLFLNSYYFDAHYIWTLFMFLPPAFFGSTFGITTTVYSYISHMHHEDDRNMRFIIAQIFSYLGTAAGNFTCAFILPFDAIFNSSQLQNYTGVFLISTIGYTCMLLWTVCVIHADHTITCQAAYSPHTGQQLPSIDYSASRICHVFDLAHVRGVIDVIKKKRSHFVRRKIILLIINVNLILLSYNSVKVAFPFVQRVYQWNAVQYSLATTANFLFRPFALILFLSCALECMKLSDLKVAIVGLVSSFLGLIAIASITTPLGIWLQIVLGSVSSLASSGTRSYIARVLPRYEVSRIFGIIITIEASQPFLSSLFYYSIFNFTISWYPTLAFHAAAGVTVLSIIIVLYVDLLTNFYPHSSVSKIPTRATIT